MSVPKIIFQTWKSHTEIPPNFVYWSNTWKQYNPEYEYKLWDDAENRAFIEKIFPWFLPIFDGYKKNIQRADAVRYFFLYYYGGIYADMDFECLKSFDTLLEQYVDTTVILGRMATENPKFTSDIYNSIPNAIMISKPRAILWLYVIRNLILYRNTVTVENSTGPMILYKAIIDMKNDLKNNNIDTIQSILPYFDDFPPDTRIVLKILDPYFVYPLSWVDNAPDRESSIANNNYDELTQWSKSKYPDSYAVTYWTHTW